MPSCSRGGAHAAGNAAEDVHVVGNTAERGTSGVFACAGSAAADGEERSRLWARADDVNQGQYTIYQSRTKRTIPVVVLEAR